MRPGPAQSVIRDGRPASSPVPECSSAHLYSCSPKLSVTRWPLVQWQDTGLWIREWWFEPTGANWTYGSCRRDGPVGAPFRAPLGEPREPRCAAVRALERRGSHLTLTVLVERLLDQSGRWTYEARQNRSKAARCSLRSESVDGAARGRFSVRAGHPRASEARVPPP